MGCDYGDNNDDNLGYNDICNFGYIMDTDHIKRVTELIGGKTYTYRSKFEYRYAVYLEVLKNGGEILDWYYEDEDTFSEVKHKSGKVEIYRPDFAIDCVDGTLALHEVKGYFRSCDATKMKLFIEQYDTPLVLIFARRPVKAQLYRAQKLEPHLEAKGGRIIWDADKSLFSKIKFLFNY